LTREIKERKSGRGIRRHLKVVEGVRRSCRAAENPIKEGGASLHDNAPENGGMLRGEWREVKEGIARRVKMRMQDGRHRAGTEDKHVITK